MKRELIFLLALWKANLIAAIEFRAAFLTQVIGMILNDGVYVLFWVIFFDRFKEIRGWGLSEMFVLFGVAASGFGLATMLFGNAVNLAEVIANGQLDYYLSLPRPVLLHVLASRSHSSALGDIIFGLLSLFFSRQFSLSSLARFSLGAFLAMVVFLSFLIIVQSLAFWMGHSQLVSTNATNALLTFAIYPIHLFEGSARFLLFTLIPAAFVGALPAEMVLQFSWLGFLRLMAGVIIFFTLSVWIFHRGLRQYESGSAIHSQA
jgi:ABC-2 type transport system permease protein